MFRITRYFSQRKYSLTVLVCLSLAVLSLSSGFTQAQGTSAAPACAVTPNMLGGQGFSVSGQGFSVSGQGFSVSGQGFSVSGQGFSVSGQGFSVSGQSVNLDPVAVANEIKDNRVTPGKWVNDRLDFFVKRLAFNSDPTAILIIDDFKPTIDGEEPHGVIVKQVVDDSIAALKAQLQQSHPEYGTLKIDSIPVDISGVDTQYNADAIANKISSTIAGLTAYRHFVLNMSFGLISCTSPATTINGVPVPAFDFTQATQVIAANNQTTPTLAVRPVLECVVRVKTWSDDDDRYYGGKSRLTDKHHDDGASYIAYFGYKNENAELVSVAIGSNNNFNSRSQNKGQPTQFEPGRQQFVFGVKFSGSNLVWSLKGPDGQTRTATASATSTPCATPPPLPTLPVTPIVECVADLGNGMYEAHFGYNNPNAVGKQLLVGTKNQLTPTSISQTQITTFAPGIHHDVFDVYFDGTDLTWTLDGTTTAVVNSSTVGCPEQVGFGLNQYISQNLGVPANLVAAYVNQLADQVTQDDFQSLRVLLRQYLSDSADPSKNFTAVTVASSGNLLPWLGPAPLAPASWKETIAVGATLDDKDDMWSFSQDGNVVAPGAGYPLPDGNFAAGTSFAAPAFSVLVGMCSTVPSALHFDGTNPPLVAASSKSDNSLIATTTLAPLTCIPNSAPTITSIADRSDKEGTAISLQVVASDPDATDVLTYTAPGLPAGVSINPTTGLISGTLAANSAGTYPVTVTVTDNGKPQGSASTSFTWTVLPAQTTVQIDIRPYSSKNRINLSSRGLVAVAVFGSSTFDATSIDPSTVTLAGAPAVKLFNKFYTVTYDVNRDGKMDRVLWFKVQNLQLTSTSTQAELLGKTFYGVSFRGVDAVKIVSPSAPNIISPANGATLRDWLVKLVWSDSEDWEEGDNVCYVVQVSKSSGFSSIVQGGIVVDRQSMITIPLTNGTYYWRVAFSDCASANVSPWSAVGNFKVQR